VGLGCYIFGRPKRVLYSADIVQDASLFLSYIGTGMRDISLQESFLLFRLSVTGNAARDEFEVPPYSNCDAKKP